jgi:hypothetical protein
MASLSLFIAGGVTLGAVKFTSTWSAPDAASTSFAGKKVAAIVMTDDMALRMSAEEALARELTTKKMNATASYRIIPGEELKNPERARAWFQRDQIAGAVVLRPIAIEKAPRYSSEIWVSNYYSTFWGYYPYAWSTVYVGGRQTGTDTTIVVESLVYNVATGKLVWGGVSESTNPKSLQTLVADIVTEAGKKIEKQFRD